MRSVDRGNRKWGTAISDSAKGGEEILVRHQVNIPRQRRKTPGAKEARMMGKVKNEKSGNGRVLFKKTGPESGRGGVKGPVGARNSTRGQVPNEEQKVPCENAD